MVGHSPPPLLERSLPENDNTRGGAPGGQRAGWYLTPISLAPPLGPLGRKFGVAATAVSGVPTRGRDAAIASPSDVSEVGTLASTPKRPPHPILLQVLSRAFRADWLERGRGHRGNGEAE